ncbi:MAG: glycosyltransferase [Candidatus Binatia bacterium]
MRSTDHPLPHISIVVPVLDRAGMIAGLLDSLLALDYPQDRYEVIVVDNGSSDGTPRVVERYPVRLLEELSVRSSYAARNRGIAASRGELIVFTDSDCVATPGWLRALAEGSDDPAYGAFAGDVTPHEPRNLVERFLAQRRRENQVPLEHPYLPFASTSNVAYRRRVFDLIGLFNPALTSSGDADLAWRMQKETPYRIAHRPRALVSHRNRTTVLEMYLQYRCYGEGLAALERLHDDLYARYSHRFGLPAPRAGVRFVRRHALDTNPGWMRPGSRLEKVAMRCLDGIVKIAFDRGIRRGRRRGEPLARGESPNGEGRPDREALRGGEAQHGR